MRINTILRGKKYIFETKLGLFSSNDIDPGTRLLIENMPIDKTDVVLDLGCGYGPVGIVAADLAAKGRVYMVDVDIRAMKYSLINSKLNKVKNVIIKPSDGFEELFGLKFDVVLSNPPSHTHKETIHQFISDAKNYLNSHGELYFVVERRIKPMFKRQLQSVFENYKEVAVGPKHIVVFAYKK